MEVGGPTGLLAKYSVTLHFEDRELWGMYIINWEDRTDSPGEPVLSMLRPDLPRLNRFKKGSIGELNCMNMQETDIPNECSAEELTRHMMVDYVTERERTS